MEATTHYVNQSNIKPPYPSTHKVIVFGMGCFWGAEKCFWSVPGVYTTAVGYISGTTSNPTYEEVCTGSTGHNEAVLVVYDANLDLLETLLTIFWQSHDPTQGMRQGNDRGSQYRSGIYIYDNEQLKIANESKENYQKKLTDNNLPIITTEIIPAKVFNYAEGYHQQYLAKNPNGYCGLGGTGIAYQ